LGDVLSEVDERARDVNGGSALQVLSLTKDYGLIRQSDRFKYRIARNDVSDYKIVRQGIIAYNPMVLWEGAIHAHCEEEPGLVSPVYPTWSATEAADWQYMDYLLKAPSMLREYLRLCSGVVKRRRTVRKEAFINILVALPPLVEQREIARILRIVQRSKSATEQVIAATLALRRSLSVHLMTWGMSDPSIGDRPSNWSSVELGSLIENGPQNGLYKPQEDYGSGTPIVRIDSFGAEGAILSEVPIRVRLTGDEIKRYALHEGDIIINRVNSLSHLGKAALVGRLGEPVVFESNMMRFAIDTHQADPEFVFRYLSSPLGRPQLVSKAKRAVAQSSVNQRDVKGVICPLPPMEEQRRIAQALSSLDKKIAVELGQQAALDALLNSMLHEFMSGRRRVGGMVSQEVVR
jgi:type I restriction enzyme S subunit